MAWSLFPTENDLTNISKVLLTVKVLGLFHKELTAVFPLPLKELVKRLRNVAPSK